MTINQDSGKRRKVLFFAEGATLAHVARPLLLAKAMDTTKFDISFCRPLAFANITDPLPFRTIDLKCQAGQVFAQRLERGLPLYDFQTLTDYVRDDLAIIDNVQPDVIVGDFRLSLSVSARLREIPYITVCDAYWSPEYASETPLPAHSLTHLIPIGIAQRAFQYIAPLAFRLHAVPMERLRRSFGLPSLNYDLRACYTDADLRLFANPPELFPELKSSPQSAFLGPIAWSPSGDINLPPTFDTKRLAYISMGSSGPPQAVSKVIPALRQVDCCALIATAGKLAESAENTEQCMVRSFLPGDRACQLADLIICNGGSPMTNQALSAGKPILGIAKNMDQFLNMQAIERHGSGLLLRADRLSSKAIAVALEQLLQEPKYQHNANVLSNPNPTAKAVEVLTQHITALLQRH